MLPTIALGSARVSRLIIGGNPFSGHSHVDSSLSAEMEDFFTTAQIKRTLTRCMECGINTMQLRADKHIMRIIREFRLEGGELNWIAQTASEAANFGANVRQALAYDPIAIYHHGTITDALFKEGKLGELTDRLKIIRDTGKPVGLGTHMPEVMHYAEEHDWGVDFYMSCVFNLSYEEPGVPPTPNAPERFEEADVPLMYEMIRSVPKPCLAFKILGATRRCATQDTVKAAFREAFQNIKPTDAVVVGMYPKTIDQVSLNSQYTREALEGGGGT